jgi:hypothetical protein
MPIRTKFLTAQPSKFGCTVRFCTLLKVSILYNFVMFRGYFGGKNDNVILLGFDTLITGYKRFGETSTLKIETACFSEMLVSTYESTRCHNSEHFRHYRASFRLSCTDLLALNWRTDSGLQPLRTPVCSLVPLRGFTVRL